MSDSGSLDTVIEARPVNDKGLHASGTIIEARPVDDEGLDTVIEAQPVIDDENDAKINDTYAATQVQVLTEFDMKAFELKNDFVTSFTVSADQLRDLGMNNYIKVEGEGLGESQKRVNA